MVLADVTGKNPNVFYELGLAHAAGKPAVIVTNDLRDVPFDLQGLRIIEYDKDHENWGAVLQKNITEALRATLADPARAVPTAFLDLPTSLPPGAVGDPALLLLRQITEELRALRSQRATVPASRDAHRLMRLLDQQTSLLHGLPEDVRLNIFVDLLQGRVEAATDQVERILSVSRERAREMAVNIADWIKLYAD